MSGGAGGAAGFVVRRGELHDVEAADAWEAEGGVEERRDAARRKTGRVGGAHAGRGGGGEDIEIEADEAASVRVVGGGAEGAKAGGEERAAPVQEPGGVLRGVDEGAEAHEVEVAECAVLEEAAEWHAAAGLIADIEMGIEVEAGVECAPVGGLVPDDRADEGEGEVVASSDGDGKEPAGEEIVGESGDAAVGFGEGGGVLT